jgi:hypothetical protein
MREAQRLRAAEQKAAAASEVNSQSASAGDAKTPARADSPSIKCKNILYHTRLSLCTTHHISVSVPRAPDFSQAQATMQAAGQKAGAYFSSWGAWAAEKRKTGWKSEGSPESQTSKGTTSENASSAARTNGPSITITPAKESVVAPHKETAVSSEKDKAAAPVTTKDEPPIV